MERVKREGEAVEKQVERDKMEGDKRGREAVEKPVEGDIKEMGRELIE